MCDDIYLNSDKFSHADYYAENESFGTPAFCSTMTNSTAGGETLPVVVATDLSQCPSPNYFASEIRILSIT